MSGKEARGASGSPVQPKDKLVPVNSREFVMPQTSFTDACFRFCGNGMGLLAM